MENFVDQTITRAEKHKNEVVTNLGIDDIRNAIQKFRFSGKLRFSCDNLQLKRRNFERKKASLSDYLEVLLLQPLSQSKETVHT